jgi:hypothetical protein
MLSLFLGKKTGSNNKNLQKKPKNNEKFTEKYMLAVTKT